MTFPWLVNGWSQPITNYKSWDDHFKWSAKASKTNGWNIEISPSKGQSWTIHILDFAPFFKGGKWCPLDSHAPRQVQAKVLHGPLLLRVLGARKIAWVWLVGLVGCWEEKSRKSLDPRFLDVKNVRWKNHRDKIVMFIPFLCLFARRCLPQMGRRIWAAGKRTANLAEKMWLEDDPFYGIFGIFSGAIFG